jgi:CRISPR-associated endonuclease/helicase Cas3
MIVTLISQCEKKALARTRRVLDAFADRIGDNTWQTVITEDGLLALKRLLRKTATKNTAVSCHLIRGRRRSELLWIVGNRNRFNAEGIVPVNSTLKVINQNNWENDWHYLPLIKALVALAALLHDWGKASVLFQHKLNMGSKKGDPLRHEWISCLLLKALVQHSDDTQQDQAWLNLLINNNWDEQTLLTSVVAGSDHSLALDNLPPIAQMVAWLIVSHHRLPDLTDKGDLDKYTDNKKSNLSSILKIISAKWGYQNKYDEADYQQRLKLCFEFQHGLLSQSSQWSKYTKKWANRLLLEMSNALETLDNGSWRIVLHHSRLCLMLGDHYYSSQAAEKEWKTPLKLFANTDPKTKKTKQFLDEHLIYVCKNALAVTQSLSRLAEDMDAVYDVKKLKKRSPEGFEWQDQAAKAIQQFAVNYDNAKQQGWFIVNMASTGKGKTIANAKIMQALSLDSNSLRYILALGLRTLTLQTGDSYQQDIGLSKDELAILIGSKAVQELHGQHHVVTDSDTETTEQLGSESLEQLLENSLIYENMPQADFMDALFPSHKAEKNKAFLYKPVLVCTIDHIMSATECKRGGKYILPCLRLLSSDLVIDEVDDFNTQDLIAIARLVHLVGMLGHKVMISSATTPPALAEGLFNAYQQGWQLYCAFKRKKNNDVIGMWVDEFKTDILAVPMIEQKKISQFFKNSHHQFVNVRADALLAQIIKHQAYIVACDDLVVDKTTKRLEQSIQLQFFERIKVQVENLHHQHHTIDLQTGKKVSFGVIRVANIPPCVALTQYLLNAPWSKQVAPRVMAYHSRQVLLLRNEQEKHLDKVLKRKERNSEQPKAFFDPDIRHHLDSTQCEHIIFILVATPVEEVGRDHDFDWAIIEPSSYRSIIQLAGRVLRHRKPEKNIQHANIALLQYNLKGLRKADVAFEKPGYEKNNRFKLNTKDLKRLLHVEQETIAINAIPRIVEYQPLNAKEKLADLEHAVLANDLTNYTAQGAKSLNSWFNETWYLTALSQRFNTFRQSTPDIQLYRVLQNNKFVMCSKDEYGQYIPLDNFYKISLLDLNTVENERLWLNRDYRDILSRLVVDLESEEADISVLLEDLSKRYGEIMLPHFMDGKKLVYSDQFGLVAFDEA